MRKFGIAVIGTGMAALPHARALKDLEDRVAVTGIYARSLERREAFAADHGFPVAGSAEALALDPATDALLLLTPADVRGALIGLFAQNGKHVLCEKPIGRTSAEAAANVAACDKAGVQLGVVFQHRFRAASRRLKELLDSGDLGAVRLARAEVPWWRPQSYYDAPGRGTMARDGGGVLISQAIHTMDLLLSLTGPVAEVQAMAATTALHDMECEDFVHAGLRFESGAVGALTATTAAYPGAPESIRLDCDKGSALLQSGVLIVQWQDGREDTFGEAEGTGGGADPMAFPHDWHRGLIAAFVDAAETGRAPSPSGRDALAVQRLIDAIMRSSSEGRLVKMEE